ncbi:hypothetical protein E2C01_097485 [Portunus trituberculatus]|uniref:Uncharacterized protein n=1 Tax=Portunus trituberculatus TaxID=210409 RepID=A0A5B7KBJ0_PORTR|nr:hypothetical protein [Portunus trituberculatus]
MAAFVDLSRSFLSTRQATPANPARPTPPPFPRPPFPWGLLQHFKVMPPPLHS